MTKDEMDLWQKQWEGVKKAIVALQARIEDANVYRKPTLETLVNALSKFAESQIQFFFDGFNDDNEDYSLQESKEYPVEYILNSILQQITYDLNVIEQAFTQRKTAENDQELVVGEVISPQPWDMLSTLKVADSYANSIVDQNILIKRFFDAAISKSDIPSTPISVLTYFRKDPYIRVVPYAPVALIGIPYTSMGNIEAFLSIPHELGHYVFWHGRLENSPIHQYFRSRGTQKFVWYEPWLEELFADVYGLLVGGPIMAFSAISLHKDNLPSNYIIDDGQHPIPAVRPTIYISALEKVFSKLLEYHPDQEEKQKNYKKKLKKQFERLLEEYGVEDDDLVHLFNAGRTRSIKKINKQLQKALGPIVDALLKDVTLKYLERFKNLSESNSTYEKIYQDELNKLKNTLASSSHRLVEATISEAKDEIYVDSMPWAKVGETNSWIDVIKKLIKTSEEPLAVPPEMWTFVMFMNGWFGGGGTETNQHPK